jgi:hypothetical protein
MFFNRLIPIPMEDDLVNTDDQLICVDPTCPDKDDDDLLTPDEATRFVQGRQL